MATFDELTIKAEQLKTIMMSRATGGQPDDHEYDILRRELVAEARLRSKIPRVLLTCRNLQEFWTFIQPKFKHYQQRRDYLREQFEPLLGMLEAADSAPSYDANSEVLSAVDSTHVRKRGSRLSTAEGTIPMEPLLSHERFSNRSANSSSINEAWTTTTKQICQSSLAWLRRNWICRQANTRSR